MTSEINEHNFVNNQNKTYPPLNHCSKKMFGPHEVKRWRTGVNAAFWPF